MFSIEDLIDRLPKTKNEIESCKTKLNILSIERSKAVELIENLSKNNIYDDEESRNKICEEIKHVIELDKDKAMIENKLAELHRNVEKTIEMFQKLFEESDEIISKWWSESVPEVISSTVSNSTDWIREHDNPEDAKEATISWQKEKTWQKEKIQQSDRINEDGWISEEAEDKEKKNVVDSVKSVKEPITPIEELVKPTDKSVQLVDEPTKEDLSDSDELKEQPEDWEEWQLDETEEIMMAIEIEGKKEKIRDILTETFSNKKDLEKGDILSAIRESQKWLLSDNGTIKITKNLTNQAWALTKNKTAKSENLSYFVDKLIKILISELIPSLEQPTGIDAALRGNLKNKYFYKSKPRQLELYEEFRKKNIDQFNEIWEFKTDLAEYSDISQFVDKLASLIESNVFMNLPKLKAEIQRFIEQKIQEEIDKYVPVKKEWLEEKKNSSKKGTPMAIRGNNKKQKSNGTVELPELPKWMEVRIQEELRLDKDTTSKLINFLKKKLKNCWGEILKSHINTTFKNEKEKITSYLEELFQDYSEFTIIDNTNKGASVESMDNSENENVLVENEIHDNSTEEDKKRKLLIEGLENYSSISLEDQSALYVDLLKYIVSKINQKFKKDSLDSDFSEWINLLFSEWQDWSNLRKKIIGLLNSKELDDLYALDSLYDLYALDIIPLGEKVKIYLNKLRCIADKIHYTVREEALKSDFSEKLVWRPSLEYKLIKILKKSLESDEPHKLRIQTTNRKYKKLELMHASDEDPRRIVALPKKCGHGNVPNEIFTFCDHSRYVSIIDSDPTNFR